MNKSTEYTSVDNLQINDLNLNSYFYNIGNTIDEFPFSTEIPRKALIDILAPIRIDNAQTKYNSRLTIQIYILFYYIQTFDGETPYFSVPELAKLCKCSKATILNVLERLEERRFITYCKLNDCNNIVKVFICNYKTYFSKYNGGFITLTFKKYSSLFGLFSSQDESLDEIVSPESIEKNKNELKNRFNLIRANLLCIASAQYSKNVILTYSTYKKYFPKYIQRRGMLGNIFSMIYDDKIKLEIPSCKLPENICLLQKFNSKDECNATINDTLLELENFYHLYIYKHGYTGYITETSRTFTDDCKFRLLHKLVNKTTKNELKEFKTDKILKLATLIIRIGNTKFWNLVNDISDHLGKRSFQSNSSTFFDKRNHRVKDLYNYLLSASYSTIA